ncbi:MAG: NAD(P)-dependent oxidoreductase [Burkholderiales bacterium]|nr:NAD(P)-dependent oxidoreductase [Burkholderiales bacterium]
MGKNTGDSLRRVCVIGGAGFLGTHIAECLSECGHYVRVFDKNPSTWIRSDQEMVVGNLLNAAEVNAAVEGCDVVYNLAALSDLNEAIDKPLDTIRVNVLGNGYVLDACRKFNVQRFLYASTIYVHSRQGGFYRCSKQACENYVEEYQKSYGLDYTILRYGSLYGPRSDNSNGLHRIVKSALETGKVQYFGSPEALREYIHIEDAARASVSALGEDFRNESIVLTGQEPMRVLDLLEMLREILNIQHPVEFVRNNDSAHYVRTPYAFQPQLGRKYIPPMHVDLGQGLIQLINEIHRDGKN